MREEVAEMIVNSALRSRIELGDLMPVLKEHGDAAKDEAVKQAIASSIWEIGLIMDRVFDQFPDLRSKIQMRRNIFGRSYL
jgi:hypothetical protein